MIDGRGCIDSSVEYVGFRIDSKRWDAVNLYSRYVVVVIPPMNIHSIQCYGIERRGEVVVICS